SPYPPEIKINLVKNSESFSWPRYLLRKRIYKWENLNKQQLKDIRGFSTQSTFLKYLNRYKKDAGKYKYVFFCPRGIVFINGNYKKGRVTFFLSRNSLKKGSNYPLAVLRRVFILYDGGISPYLPPHSLLLHAAGIKNKSRGYLFLGKNGAGKSTICRLSKGYKILHDDLIKAEYQAKDKRFRIYALRNPLQKVELKQLFFIKKSRRNKIERMPAARALREGIKNTFDFQKSVFFKDFSDNKIEMAMKLFRKVPAYKLYFRKDSSFWELIRLLKDNGSLKKETNAR
ncbi:MAG: hypothetical protein Q8N14_00135, partial [Candidatus Omnitrophota bacterium]|nr:hypothetical protein [Candidatus Omnitrophota bacterium]